MTAKKKDQNVPIKFVEKKKAKQNITVYVMTVKVIFVPIMEKY